MRISKATAAEIGEEVRAISGPQVGDAAVHGPEEIADALVRTRGRFALELVQIALHGDAGKLGRPPPKALCGP